MPSNQGPSNCRYVSDSKVKNNTLLPEPASMAVDAFFSRLRIRACLISGSAGPVPAEYRLDGLVQEGTRPPEMRCRCLDGAVRPSGYCTVPGAELTKRLNAVVGYPVTCPLLGHDWPINEFSVLNQPCLTRWLHGCPTSQRGHECNVHPANHPATPLPSRQIRTVFRRSGCLAIAISWGRNCNCSWFVWEGSCDRTHPAVEDYKCTVARAVWWIQVCRWP